MLRRSSNPVEELLQRAPAARPQIVRNVAYYQRPSICRMLIDRSTRLRYCDPHEMVRVSHLAVLAGERCNPVDHELLGEAWMQLGVGLMVRGTLRAAEEAFSRAEQIFSASTAATLPVRLRLQESRASLRLRQLRVPEARQLIDGVLEIRRLSGDAQAYAAALCQSAIIYGEGAGQSVQALAEINRALDMMDPEADPQLYLLAQHNGARFLIDRGEGALAMLALERLGPLYRRAGDPILLLRRRWAYAQAAATFGRAEMDDLAEREFRATAKDATARALPYEAASVLLELGLLFAARRRYALLPDLVEEILPFFEAMGIAAKATTAQMLRQVALDQFGAAETLRAVLCRLRRRRR